MSVPYDTAQELAQLSGLMLTAEDVATAMHRVTAVAKAVVPRCDGASVTMLERGVPTASSASDPWARALDRLQVEEQEGPCLDCLREGSVMRVRDLAADARFPSYGPRAGEQGACSALSLPMTNDGRNVGALNLYSRESDAFGTEEVAVTALLAGHASLALQAATAFFSHRDLAAQLQDAMRSRAEIEQAKGIIMGQRGVGPEEAFRALVERSQRTNRKLRDVAREVVEGRVDPDA